MTESLTIPHSREAEEAVRDELRAFADWIYRQLEQDHDYLMSDEAVDEASELLDELVVLDVLVVFCPIRSDCDNVFWGWTTANQLKFVSWFTGWETIMLKPPAVILVTA